MCKKILFVCTGNTCRSAMAAAIFNDIAVKKDLDVMIESAGIAANPGEGASENAVKVMAEAGIDLTYHRAKQLTPELMEIADVILTMTEGHKRYIASYAPEKVFTLKEYIGAEGDIKDPFGGGIEVYRETAEELSDALNTIAEKINDNS